ncbi:hypothetical protein ACQPZ2_20625 [Nocardia pseudovaccinii]|uniref:hypothetical protein n=1 Tax=Nocardia pseudovaccinii TaxID=189540 RepID=UPI003D8C2FAD
MSRILERGGAGAGHETASQLLTTPPSALMLPEDLNVEPGERIAINAAKGAVGLTRTASTCST